MGLRYYEPGCDETSIKYQEDSTMRTQWFVSMLFALILCAAWVDVWADPPQFPQNATFTTLVTTTRAIEGLTGDNAGYLYTGGSGSGPCPIYKINMVSKSIVTAGNVQAASCGFSGIAFDASGNLFVANGGAGTIYTLRPNTGNPPNATVFASGVPGTNGLAFDRDGNLWTGDGTTGLGRVWRITGAGADCSAATPVKCEEVFRIQPMRNGTALGGNVSTPDTQGVGRQARDFPPGTTANSSGGQDLVANGVAFNHQGDLFVIDTARGALWKAQFDQQGNLKSPTGCDSTFKADTLCLSNVFVAHPILEGGDGIALDTAGNIWVDANERNAVAVVTKDGRVAEIFRNPVNADGLRNSADASVGNNHILEFPTSPFLTGKIFCTSQSDGDRRDNSPRSAGEVNAGAPQNGTNLLGKISCMDQDLVIPGLRLPIR
jgi:sugar lactone lactonase YvrE